MPYSGCVDDFLAIRRGRLPTRVPVVTHSEEFDVKWHGRYTYEEFCQSGEKMFEVVRTAVDHFDYDWAWLQIDDCFEFEPLGVGVHGEGNILRATCKYLPASRKTLESLPTMEPRKDGRMPEKLKALRLLDRYYDGSCLVVGSCAAPFSAVGLMRGIEESMVLLLTYPELLYDAMQYWCDFYKRFVEAQRDAGAHAIWLGGSNAFSNLVSAAQYTKHILSVTCELVQYCEKELDVMVWLHNSETKVEHILSHLPLGCSFENIGPAGDMREIRYATRGRMAISGNLDPLEVLWKGTPALVASEVRRILDICKPGGNYICNTGEMNPRDVSEANMLAYVQTAKDLGKY